jgi:glycosyltransferase involved in cell wall biosynthesis
VIAPGVDLAAFAPGGARASVPTILCAADPADPRKRVGVLAAAFARVREERPDARLVVQRPGDPAVAAALGLDAPGVELADLASGGGPGRAEIAAANRAAWVAALPSVDEGFGLVLLEALACGTPVVGTTSGALPEIVDRPEVGRLCEPDDPAALAAALLEALALAEDPATAAACRARGEDFAAAATGAAYAALYGEILARH